MKTISYALPEKARKIWEELAQLELNQSSFFSYLSFCLMNLGYENAARKFFDEANEERVHFKMIVDFLQLRGVKMEVPAIAAPSVEITDLKGGIKMAFETEISVTEKYAEFFELMRDIDSMSYIELEEFMGIQKRAIQQYQDAWTIFSKLEGYEDQKEQEVLYYGYKNESPVN